MKKILLGAGLEILAFAVLLFSESWGLPITLSLFAHLNAVFFFTKGFDERLHLVHLRREICFFFSLIFPLAGMAGIGFFILVLKRIEPRIRLPEAAPLINAPAQLASEETAFLEDDYFSSLDAAFVRKVTAPLHHPQAWHNLADSLPVDSYREVDYWRREKTLSARIRDLEAELAAVEAENTGPVGGAPTAAAGPAGAAPAPEAANPVAAAALAARESDTRRRLADTLLEYVTLFQADPRLREHYLGRAADIYGELAVLAPEDTALLENLVETAFLDGRYRECLAHVEKLRRLDSLNVTALLRSGESLFRLRDYRKLSGWSREISGNQAVPAAIRELAQVWSAHG
jgi:hypothetical protein